MFAVHLVSFTSWYLKDRYGGLLESDDDLFLTQINFQNEEDISTREAIYAANSLDQFLDYDHRQFTNGETVGLLDFSEQRNNSSEVTDDMLPEDFGDFSELSFCLNSFRTDSIQDGYLVLET